jgi:hypothetical protein
MGAGDRSSRTHRGVNASEVRHRLTAGWLVLASGVVALVLGPAAIELVREQLHISCSMGRPGSEGASTWTCSDGVGYLGVAVVLGAMWFLVVVVGSLVAMLVSADRAARLVLVLLAAMSTAWILGWTWYGSSELVQDEHAPMTGAEYWGHAVGPAAVASILGLAAGLISLLLQGQLSWIVGIGAAVGLAIATIYQLGLSLNTLPAVGLLAAAALRSASNSRIAPPSRKRLSIGASDGR